VKYTFPESEKEFHQYYVNKCPGDCHKCTDICPNDAIHFRSSEEAWESKQLIDIDEDRCIRCGGCMLVCPQDNYHVQWTKILTSGPYNEIFWNPIQEKLMKRTLVLTGKMNKPGTQGNEKKPEGPTEFIEKVANAVEAPAPEETQEFVEEPAAEETPAEDAE
jgi:ferredoxin